MQHARCMHIRANISKKLWVEAVNIACYLVNISPSTTIYLKNPQEVWFRKPSDYFGLHIFGYPVYTHVNDGKIDTRAMKCILLEYASRVKGYQWWCIEEG